MTNASKFKEIQQVLKDSFNDKEKWHKACKDFDKLFASAPKDLIPFYNWLRQEAR